MKRYLLLLLMMNSAAAFETGRAGFSVRVNDNVIPYRVFAVFVLPGERFEIEALEVTRPPELSFAAGRVERIKRATWRATAPERRGVYEIAIESEGRRMQLNVVVMHPAGEITKGYLNGFRVGSYPKKPLNGNPAYRAPAGFVELNEQTASLQLSPHFVLSQFPAKQPGGYPKYVVVRERLLLKLELLLQLVNDKGFAADTLTVMSGYRTPWYNASIRNVPHSRHVYGGAADVFVDTNGDGLMDDLNRDGKISYADAQLLYVWANELYGRRPHRSLRGGMGVYRSTAAHGPFVHIDERGSRARWGLLP